MPTVAEKPMPIANDHHGSETGKPAASGRPGRCAADHDAEQAAERRQEDGLEQELPEDLAAPGAERLAHADLARALGDRDHHDRHHPDAADHQGDRGDHHQREERGPADLLPAPAATASWVAMSKSFGSSSFRRCRIRIIASTSRIAASRMPARGTTAIIAVDRGVEAAGGMADPRSTLP